MLIFKRSRLVLTFILGIVLFPKQLLVLTIQTRSFVLSLHIGTYFLYCQYQQLWILPIFTHLNNFWFNNLRGRQFMKLHQHCHAYTCTNFKKDIDTHCFPSYYTLVKERTIDLLHGFLLMIFPIWKFYRPFIYICIFGCIYPNINIKHHYFVFTSIPKTKSSLITLQQSICIVYLSPLKRLKRCLDIYSLQEKWKVIDKLTLSNYSHTNIITQPHTQKQKKKL